VPSTERPYRNHLEVGRSYDAVAVEYLKRLGRELEYKPLDRALLGALIEQTAHGPIADLGCGPGHVAAWLLDHGVGAVGVDLSHQMIAVGRRAYPGVDFRQGDFLRLPAADREFGAVVALYSIIHLPPDELPIAFEEMRRVLTPGGLLLIAFHVGNEVRHSDEWWGHEVDLDFRFLDPDAVITSMEGSGFVVEARIERINYPDEVATRRAYLLARLAPDERQ
jgi:SAM-dependent methyltransferase